MVDSKRDELWQSVRGLCILGVVAFHTPGISFVDSLSIDCVLFFSLRQLFSFCVPVFLFMAGYFVKEQIICDQKNFFKKRCFRLLVPYFIWSIIYISIQYFQYSTHGLVFSLKDVFIELLTGGATAPLYYIIVLMQLTLLTPFLIKCVKFNKRINSFIWLITPLYLFFFYVFNVVNGDFPKFYNLPFLGWLFFYWLGINTKMNFDFVRLTFFEKKRSIFLLVVFCFFEGAIFLNSGIPKIAISQMKLSSMLFSMGLCVFFCSRKKMKIPFGKEIKFLFYLVIVHMAFFLYMNL